MGEMKPPRYPVGKQGRCAVAQEFRTDRAAT